MSDLNYDPQHIAFLEELWGEGYLSPGGPQEVAELLSGIDLKGKRVLDIGSGSGGITVSLAHDYGAAEVIGIDVEEPVCVKARERVAAAGLEGRVIIQQIDPDQPIPFEDGSFDIVFSKDSIVHIPNKEELAIEAYRLLRPNGWFVASDWLISHDGEPSPEMAHYIKLEDLGFGMASPQRYQKALNAAQFVDIKQNNRNSWYFNVAQQELARLQNDKDRFIAAVGEEWVNEEIELWEAMLVVLETGEHCPHHFRGRKAI